MDEIKNKSYGNDKGFYGYVERLQQYALNGENVIINIHSNAFMNFHLHDFYEINYIAEGECDNLFAHGSIHMTKGDFIIISPDAMHSLFVDDTSLVYNFLISRSFMHSLFSKIKECNSVNFLNYVKNHKTSSPYASLFVKSNALSNSIAERILHVTEQSNASLILESLITILLVTFSNNEHNCFVSKATVDGTHVLKNIFSKMESDYQNVSLDSIAREFGYSKTYICILFKKHYNSTFSNKLNEIKLLHAKKMLLDTNFSISDIASNLGFESVEYFHRLFKKNCGITPNKYRTANKQ